MTIQKFTTVRNKDDPYVTLNKTIFSDPCLSWRAKGLWAYLMSRPDGWQVYENDLINKGTEGRDAIRKSVKELEAAGYIRKERKRDDTTKRFRGIEYLVYENPVENFLVLVDKKP